MNSQPEDDNLHSGTGAEDPTTKAGSKPGRLQNRAQKMWLAFAALLVALAAAAYLYPGGHSRLPISAAPGTSGDSSSPAATGPGKSRKALSEEQLERMVAQAAAQTQEEPTDASAWAMLAHSYEMLGKFAESAAAYSKLAQLLPNDAQVLADYADVLAVTNGRSFKGEPIGLLRRALAIDSKNAKALFLAGSAYIQEQDYVEAMSHLEMARTGSTDAEFLRQIDGSIARAKALSGDATVATVPPAQGDVKADAVGGGAAAQVSGRVWVAESLRAKAPAQATLFLYARPTDGSRMPVALLRKKVSDLPMSFTLDDSMAMVPNMSLSKLSTVVVVARVSIRGDVTPAAGDLEGVSAPVSVGTKDLKLEITEVLK